MLTRLNMTKQLSQKGIVLMEVLVGLAISTAITVAYLNGLNGAYKGVNISQEIVTAEGLARSQIEDIRVQDYVYAADYNPADPANRYEVVTIPADLISAGYTVEIETPGVVIDRSEGFELQSVNVTVSRSGRQKLLVNFYRISG